jgi:predicted DsbA family dithiol-disulfide isomerase
VRTDKLRRKFDLAIRWRVFPLHPETPDEGLELSDLFAGHYDIGAMLQRCQQVAEELELPYGTRTRTYNSRRAQELGKWAEEQGCGDAFHMAVYHAYFVDAANIATPEILAGIAASVGLDPGAALEVIDKRSYAAHVDEDWQRAAELGVTAVPTTIYREQALVGFQSYPSYRQLVTETR